MNCIKARARCTTCGFSGIDSVYNHNQESNGKHPHVKRDQSLWFCGKGCYNLLCSRCGTVQDGCQLHSRSWPATIWYSHWGARRFEGKLWKQAATLYLSPEETAFLQNAFLPMANPPAVLAMPIAYAPQVIPAPAILADGTTLYAG